MMVRSGWSANYAARKFDVEFHDQDLILWLSERGIDAGAMDLLTLHEKFFLLYYEAQIFCIGTRSQYESDSKDIDPVSKAKMSQLVRDQNTILEKVRKRLGIDEPG
jgi:hypothetical protein